MKTLVNKDNPQIRITAPEITTAHPPVSNEGYVYWIPAINEMYNPIDWTLVEEEQKPTEWSEEDEAMRDNILRVLSCFVGTLECDSNPSLRTSYLVYQREIDWLKSLKPQRR